MKLIRILLALAALVPAAPPVDAAQVAGGRIGAVIAPASAPHPVARVAVAHLPAPAAPTVPPPAPPVPKGVRPWGGLKLDLNPSAPRTRG